MSLEAAGFDWDAGNREKCQKHGVSAAAIEAMFERSVAVLPDPAHSHGEERLKAIGTDGAGRHILLVFTLRRRGEDVLIRPISARYMHRREVEYFEKEVARIQER